MTACPLLKFLLEWLSLRLPFYYFILYFLWSWLPIDSVDGERMQAETPVLHVTNFASDRIIDDSDDMVYELTNSIISPFSIS